MSKSLAAGMILLMFSAAAAAAALEPPRERVLLSVSGAITESNTANGVAEFDRTMLQALPQRDTKTRTPWYDDVSTFSGPLLRALLQAVGATGSSLRVIALNDYEVTVPIQDFYDYEVILAMSRNGRTLSVREHGPLFIIYPFDEHPELMTESILTRSVWQIKEIVVE